jgi:hypothetical protein
VLVPVFPDEGEETDAIRITSPFVSPSLVSNSRECQLSTAARARWSALLTDATVV